MRGLVIAVIPAEDDRTWKISSEKIPHLTLLFLGDPDNVARMPEIAQFLEHAASTTLKRFSLTVDRRGPLGADDADVLFFEKTQDKTLERFRANLLMNHDIAAAYNAAEQYPEWHPHLTLGYPEEPAKTDDLDYGINWVQFDRIALWTGDYEGPTFQLDREEFAMSDFTTVREFIDGSDPVKKFLAHHGIKGQKWGVRRSEVLGTTNLSTLNVTGAVKTIPLSGRTMKNPTGKISADAAHATHAIGSALVDGQNGPFAKGGSVKKLNEEWRSSGKAADSTHRDAYDTRLAKTLTDEANKLTKMGTNARVHIARLVDGDVDMILTVGSREANAGYHSGLKKRPDVEVVHADGSELEILVYSTTLDSDGLVTGIKEAEVDVKHAEALDKFLAHHGIKGMKWGVRRNLDSSGAEKGGSTTTPASDADGSGSSSGSSSSSSSSTSSDVHVSADAERFIKTRQKDGVEMSDREIREALNRAKMVTEYDTLFNSTPAPNAALKNKVEQLELQKKYSQLNAELHPSATARVKSLIQSSVDGYGQYKKLDEATDGKLSAKMNESLATIMKAVKTSPVPKHL